MAKRPLTQEDLDAIYQLARKWGKIVCRQAFGDEGPGLDVDFTKMEDVAVAASRGVPVYREVLLRRLARSGAQAR